MKNVFKSLAVLLFALASLGLAQTEGAQEGFVERPDGARIYYQVQGEGEPMMLIHGYPLNSGLFRDNVPALVEAGYQVVTPDLRGFGQSEAPDGSATIQVYAEDMLAVMDELGIDQTIALGMSMGGWTLFEMYAQAPERFSGLVFNDTAAVPASIAGAALWRGIGQQAEETGIDSVIPFLIKDMFTGQTRTENTELVDYLSGLMGEASVNGFLGGGEALAVREDNTDVYAQITVPTLIIFGIEDTLTPVALANAMNEAIVNSTLEIIDGASHASIIERSDAANQAILDWAQGMQ